MKKKILKRSLIASILLILIICGLFFYLEKVRKVELIEYAKKAISKSVADTSADMKIAESSLIEIKDISKPQTIEKKLEIGKLNEVESLIGRYQFNSTGARCEYERR